MAIGLLVSAVPADAVTPITPECRGLQATLIGTSGPDTLTGGPGRAVIAGLGGTTPSTAATATTGTPAVLASIPSHASRNSDSDLLIWTDRHERWCGQFPGNVQVQPSARGPARLSGRVRAASWVKRRTRDPQAPKIISGRGSALTQCTGGFHMGTENIRLRALTGAGAITLLSGGLLTVGATPAAAALPAGCVDGGATITCTYNDSSAVKHFTVPAGVVSALITVRGGSGATGTVDPPGPDNTLTGGTGGKGGVVTAKLPVTSGVTLDIWVGSAATGANGAVSGGSASGGNGDTHFDGANDRISGGGGGGTFVFPAGGTPTGVINPLVAAGGGGGGDSLQAPNGGNGGAGGGATGGNGTVSGATATPGTGGTTTTGGVTGGGRGIGGNANSLEGGGGGGGYWGGGGAWNGTWGGGGGGSGFVPAGATVTAAGNTGNGSVRITYTDPADLRCGGLRITKFGTDGNDVIGGTPNRDVILAFGGNDTVHGGGGNDVICGGSGADTIHGDSGADTILGGSGTDVLNGGVGADKIRGGRGDDSLAGNRGRDLLAGGAGDDELSGGRSDDRLFGGRGDDELAGNYGDDFLHGGRNRDLGAGGAGTDTLVSIEDVR